jgi:hypothetical protein
MADIDKHDVLFTKSTHAGDRSQFVKG